MSELTAPNGGDKPAFDDLIACVICTKTLKNPMLLHCLHSVCRLCLKGEAGELGGNDVTCPDCRVASSVTTDCENLILSAEVERLTALRKVHTCSICSHNVNSNDSMADFWCTNCSKSMCQGCFGEHKKHVSNHRGISIDETTDWSTLLRLPERLCSEHKKELQLVCFSCEKALCLACAKMSTCIKDNHDTTLVTELATDPKATERLLKIKDCIQSLVANISSSSFILDLQAKLEEDLKSAHESNLATLKAAKKCAADAVSFAHENAEKELKHCYETLETKASELRCTAELLKRRVSYVSRYISLALNSEDTVGLLIQLKTLRSQLRDLAQRLSILKEPVDSTKLVHMSVRLPNDLDQITGAWMGHPKLCTEDPCCSPDALNVYTDEPDYNAKKELLSRQLEVENKPLVSLQQECHTQHDQQLQKLEEERQNLARGREQLANQIKGNEESMRKQQETYQLQSQELEREREERHKLQKLLDVSILDLYEIFLKFAQEQQDNQIKEYEENKRKQQETYQLQSQKLEREREERHKLQKLLDVSEERLKVAQALQTPLSFGPASGSWKYPHECYDVAVTAEGTVLVAALEEGLKECDKSRQLHCWRPKREFWLKFVGVKVPVLRVGYESVRTVDVLDDGRAAVGLRDSKFVVLLRRCPARGGAWLVDKQVDVLQSPPRRLSVHGDLLAACEDRRDSETNGWVCGPQLVLVKLCCDTKLYSRKLEYDICSVAVTAQIVVTSSNCAVKLSDGREKYVVDGYSHSGERLWRHEPSNKAVDVCLQPFGHVLYLAVDGHNVVMASSVIDDGQNLKEVLAYGSHAVKGIYALSLAKGKQSVLAVLSRDEKDIPCKVTVSVPATKSAAPPDNGWHCLSSLKNYVYYIQYLVLLGLFATVVHLYF